MRVPHAVRC